MASSILVIKVKYGEALRRFSRQIDNGEFRLDMVELREKVVSLFNFPADSDFTLTYIDEDGDEVTLADNDDLDDIMRQSLNPLRISVSLVNKARSSGSSTDGTLPGVQTETLVDEGVSGIVKSISETVDQGLSRRSSGLISKAKSSRPLYFELLNSLLKMSLTNLKEDSIPRTICGASGGSKDEAVPEEKECSKSNGITPAVQLKCSEAKGNLAGFHAGSVMCVTNSANALHGEKFSIGLSEKRAPRSFVPVGDNIIDQAKCIGESNERRSYGGDIVKGGRDSVNSPGEKMKEIKMANYSSQGCKTVGFGALSPINSWNPKPLNCSASATNGFARTKVAAESGNSLWAHLGIKSNGKHPFNDVPSKNYSSSLPGHHYAHRMVPAKRNYNHSGDGIGTIVHSGVSCDGCGVHPITGLRFKSKVKEDYDLCSICFADMGNETDYIRMNRRMNYSRDSLNDFYDPMQSYRWRSPTLPQLSGGSASLLRLDSCFIQDINIMDGTIMAPSTTFTKIWCMKNNGTAVWPQMTQLLWIGGDRFSKTLSVTLEIPANGCPLDKEIDIAVDFCAPEYPGRYISYWRMASPSGQQFGQHVWVLIQVDASLKNTLSRIVQDFNMNLPPVSPGMMSSQLENANLELMAENGHTKRKNCNRATDLVDPVVDAPSNEYEVHNVPANDILLVGGDTLNPSPLDASSVLAHPAADFPKFETISTSLAQNSDTSVPSSVIESKDNVELTSLKEVEEMGFKEIDLKKETLRMNNNYDLEQSVDDLCGVEGWDPMLKELQEMGFFDKEMNAMLLKKNNGSIKRVVMDLIAAEKSA